jgi:hypothetical protein
MLRHIPSFKFAHEPKRHRISRVSSCPAKQMACNHSDNAADSPALVDSMSIQESFSSRTSPNPPILSPMSSTMERLESLKMKHPLVEWDGNLDPERPRDWPLITKICICTIVFINAFVLDWSSSIDSQARSKITASFVVSKKVESLSSACYIFGIGIGALSAGSIAQAVGRNPIYLLSKYFVSAPSIHTEHCSSTKFGHTNVMSISCAGLGVSTILAIHEASIADSFGPGGRCIVWQFAAVGCFLGKPLLPES